MPGKQRSPRMVRDLVAIDREFAEVMARARDAERSQRVLSALRWMVAEPDILTKLGYALVPLEATRGMLEAGAPDYEIKDDPTRPDLEYLSEMILAAQWRAMVAASAEPDDPT